MHAIQKSKTLNEEFYSFLAWGFDDPGKGIITEYAISEILPGIHEQVAETEDSFIKEIWSVQAERLDILREQIRNTNEEALLDIRRDYAKLFYGPMKLLAPPYESVYREDHVVMGHCTVEVIQFYKEFGLQLSPEIKNLPDHVMVELDFLGYIESEKNYYTSDSDEFIYFQEGKDLFLTEHVLKWVNQFIEKTKTHALTGYYSLLAPMLESHIKLEIHDISLRSKQNTEESVIPVIGNPLVQTEADYKATKQKNFKFPIFGNTFCTLCGSCSRVCTEASLVYHEIPNEKALLLYNTELCTGCGKCIKACPQQNITASLEVMISETRPDEKSFHKIQEAELQKCTECSDAFAPKSLVDFTILRLTDVGIISQDSDSLLYRLCPNCRTHAAMQTYEPEHGNDF